MSNLIITRESNQNNSFSINKPVAYRDNYSDCSSTCPPRPVHGKTENPRTKHDA